MFESIQKRAPIALLFLFLFLILGSLYYIALGRSLQFGALLFNYCLFLFLGTLYYILKGNQSNGAQNSKHHPTWYSPVLGQILRISFFLVLSCTSIVLLASWYTKPFVYYFLIAMATAIVGILIVAERDDRKKTYATLFLQIIPLAVVVRASSMLINTGLVGADQPDHLYWVSQITTGGHLLPDAFHYYYYPFYHLDQAVGGLIFGLSINSFNIVNLVEGVIAVLVAYLIGKQLFRTDKAGLMCSLLFAIASSSLYEVFSNQSKIGATTLLLLCVYLLLKIIDSRDRKTLALFWIVAFFVFFWYPEVSLVLLFILLAKMASDIYSKKKLGLDTAFTLYAIAFVGYLAFVHTGLYVELLSDIFIPTTETVVSVGALSAAASSVFFVQLSLNYLMISVPLFFVAYAGLRWFSKRDAVGIFVVFAIISTHLVSVIGAASGSGNIGPARLIFYANMLVILVMGGTMVGLFHFDSKRSFAVLAAFLFVLSFFSVSSYLVGDANSVFDNAIPVQTTFATTSLSASFNFLNATPKGSTITSDHDSMSKLENYNGTLSAFKPDLTYEEFPELNSSVYVVLNQPNFVRAGWPNNAQGNAIIKYVTSANELYDNGDVSVYRYSLT